jgi:hypothetical protein
LKIRLSSALPPWAGTKREAGYEASLIGLLQGNAALLLPILICSLEYL